MIFDVVVCGAGPAGATVARMLAEAGLKVLICEKKRLPRYKACGGGLTRKTWEELPLGWEDLVEDAASRVIFYHREKQPISYDFEEPVVKLVMRDKLDMWLVERAVASGAQVRDGLEMEGVVVEDGLVRVRAGSDSFLARIVVGADGARSLVARMLPFRPSRTWGVALEWEWPASKVLLEEFRGSLVFSYGNIAGGYAWIFPKAAHLSVGIGSFNRTVRGLVQLMERFCEGLGLCLPTCGLRRGALIPSFLPGEACWHTEQGLLVGDAAGMVDPFSGEGLYYALKTGRMAAASILSRLSGRGELKDYSEAIRAEIVPELTSAYRIAKVVYAFTPLVHRLVKASPEIGKRLVEVLCGMRTYTELWRYLSTRFRIFRQEGADRP